MNVAMNWILIIFAVNFCVHDLIEAYTDDVSLVATSRIDDQEDLDNSGVNGVLNTDAIHTQESTGSRDVSCTTIDDVTAVRTSLCPAQCKCSPLNDHEVLTTLTVNCSGAKFNQSTSSRLIQDLTQLLSRCVSELTELTITNGSMTTVPEVVCRLSKIRLLVLESSQLASLPSNCFTRMLNLVYLSIAYNHLTTLQVR